jgi:hypothetical protein
MQLVVRGKSTSVQLHHSSPARSSPARSSPARSTSRTHTSQYQLTRSPKQIPRAPTHNHALPRWLPGSLSDTPRRAPRHDIRVLRRGILACPAPALSPGRTALFLRHVLERLIDQLGYITEDEHVARSERIGTCVGSEVLADWSATTEGCGWGSRQKREKARRRAGTYSRLDMSA